MSDLVPGFILGPGIEDLDLPFVGFESTGG